MLSLSSSSATSTIFLVAQSLLRWFWLSARLKRPNKDPRVFSTLLAQFSLVRAKFPREDSLNRLTPCWLKPENFNHCELVPRSAVIFYTQPMLGCVYVDKTTLLAGCFFQLSNTKFVFYINYYYRCSILARMGVLSTRAAMGIPWSINALFLVTNDWLIWKHFDEVRNR